MPKNAENTGENERTSHRECGCPPSVELQESGLLCRCGAEWKDDGQSCRRGHPRPGTPGPALEHGGRSLHVRLALIAEHRATLASERAAILADLGGAENVGTLKAGLIDRYQETALVASWLGGNLLVDGVLTGKGKARAAATLYLQVLDRLLRLSQALGLDRQQRAVPSPLDYMKGETL